MRTKIKNKLVTFSLILWIIGIFVLLNYPQKADAINFLSETWDTGTPPAGWPCKDAPNYDLCNAVQNTPFNGWYTNGYCDYAELSSVGLSTTRAHSGTRSFYQLRATGQYAGCDIIHDISSPYPTKIHIRFYLFLDSNYINYNTPTSREPMGHFLFTNIALSGAGFRINLLSKVPYIQDHVCASGKGNIPPNQPYMFFNCGNDTEHCTVGAPSPCYNLLEHLNEWQCVEFMLDATNKKYNVWINGTKYVDNITVPMTQNNFTMVQFSPWVSDDISFNTSYYLDDIVVADSYIGCNGGDTQAPSVPANLTAQAVSSSQINLSWTASTDNVAVTGYRIYRCAGSSCTPSTQIATSTTNSYSDTGFSASTTYTYAVSAVDAAGNESLQSGSASATTSSSGSGGGSGSGDTSASGGSGCGFVKDDGKGPRAKGEGLSFVMILIIILVKILLNRRASIRKKILWAPKSTISMVILFFFVAYTPAHATMYFYYDAENETVGNSVPRDPNGIDICTQGCSTSYSDATIQSAGGVPQGSKYFQWVTIDNQPSVYTEVVNHTTFPISLSLGTTYYLAYFFNFTRINALDIWHETGQSADKGVEIDGSGIRWIISRGNWSCIADTQDHYYTVWTGNPTYVLNPSPIPGCVDNIFGGNQNGYSASNPIQLQYERWYSAVMAVKIASNNTGYVAFWIDGVKVGEYNNIITAANNSPTINYIGMGGTIAQGANDAPAHYRKYDALMLTDNWQDIVDGGYLKGGGDSGGDTPPPPSSGSSGGDSSASGGSGCGYIKDANGKGPGAKGEGLSLIIMLIVALAGIVLARRISVFQAQNK